MDHDTGASRTSSSPLDPRLGIAVLASGVLFGFGGQDIRPPGLGEVIVNRYADGDDLLTAGLGRTGLASAALPAIADPAAPTPAELRRRAIHANYRALVDTTEAGGFGRLYGPNIDLAGNDTLGEGLVPGTEHLAYVKNVSGVRNVTVLVQVPDAFNVAHPCIVAAPSSGSRGVYGAIGTTGEWALKRGCAVAYTDKGTGAGAHELATDLVTLIDGRLATATEAEKDALFAAPLTPAQRAAYLTDHPDRYAMKHAHSGDNPERIWGRATLHAVEFAFHVLNRLHEPTAGETRGRRPVPFHPDNTIVIAASVSNGGGASIAAAEEDRRGLIDAVVVAEPQINVRRDPRVRVMRGGNVIATAALPLYDYTTWSNLMQPCAAIAPSNAASPLLVLIVSDFAANRCAALAAAGLVEGATVEAQAEDAAAKLVAHGWEPESALLHASHFGLSVATAVSVTYANAFARASVTDDLCGYSMGTTDAATGLPAPPAPSPMPTVWAANNGVPPSTGINLIAEDAANGPIREALGVSPSTGRADYYWDGAMCLRGLLDDARVQGSVAQTRVKGDLGGRPAIILHGRSDTLVPVNHTSRPYLGLNSLKERGTSRLSYVEVTNAQHFEAFLPVPGYDNRLIPLHWYGGQALDLMWSHLVDGTPLPPSQVVRTVPRGGSPGAAPPLTEANLPPIAIVPAGTDVITAVHGEVHVPD